MILAYRCAYCSQWNPSLKPKPQLAIGFDNNSASTPNGLVTSTETIEEITDDMSLKSDSEHSENTHSEQKKLITSMVYNNS